MYRIFYSLPAFVLAFPTIPVFVLLPTFYGETIGLGLATVGVTLFILRICDVVSDPVLGWLSDHIPETYGKRKLPMTLGGLIGAPALIALFSPPAELAPDGAGIVYLFVCGLVLYLAWTAIQIPYLAWAAELETDYRARTKLNSYREAFGLLGILAVGGMGVLLGEYDELTRMTLTAWITVGIGAVIFVLALWRVPNKHPINSAQPIYSAQQRHKEYLKRQPARTGASLSFPRNNKLFLRVLAAWFCNGLANGLPAVCLPLFLTYILEADDTARSVLLFIYFLCAVAGIPVWLWLANRFSKHRVWCGSMLFACLVFLGVPFLTSGDVIAFGVICALTGMALGSDLALPPAIQADCADWDKYRFRVDRLATLYAYWSMATKLALGFAVGLAFPILDFFALSEQGTSSKVALLILYAGIPVVLKVCAVGLMWHFPLTQKKHAAVQHFLEKCS